MILSHRANALKLRLPDDIEQELFTNLRIDEDGMQQSANTAKYIVEGRPDLYVRNEGDNPTEARKRLAATQRLRKFGLHILPATIVERDDSAYLITKRVQGIALNRHIAVEQDYKTWQLADGLLNGVGRSLLSARRTGRLACDDIDTTRQYMLGSIAGEPKPKPWLVDFSLYASNIASPHEDSYNCAVLHYCNGIVETEQLAGGLPLIQSRNTAKKMIQNIKENDSDWTNARGRAAGYVLEHGIEISSEDDDQLQAFM